eukprot:15340815-Ditylum_brightwellii.AAC.1
MEEINIIKHWILPEQKLNKGTRYKNSMPGNAPEFNALDSNLNHNTHCDILKHVSYTSSSYLADEQKFSVST